MPRRSFISISTMRASDRLKPIARRNSSASPPVKFAQIIAMRLGPPPAGYANWSLRLLARKVVELEIVEAISHETVRRTLKKTG